MFAFTPASNNFSKVLKVRVTCLVPTEIGSRTMMSMNQTLSQNRCVSHKIKSRCTRTKRACEEVDMFLAL